MRTEDPTKTRNGPEPMHQIRSESVTVEVLSCEGRLACRIGSHVTDSQRTDSMTLETYGLKFWISS